MLDLLETIRNILAHFGIILEAKIYFFEVILALGFIIRILLVAPHRHIYTHFTNTQANRESILPWLEEKGLAEKYKSLVRWLSAQLQRFYGDASSARAFLRSWSIAMIYPIGLFLIAYTFFSGSPEFAGMEVLPESEKNRFIIFCLIILIAGVFLLVILRENWLRNPFQHLFKRVWLQNQSYRLVMALLSVLITMTYSSNWIVLVMMASLGYLLGAVAVAVAFAFAVAGIGAIAVAIVVGVTVTATGAVIATGTVIGTVAGVATATGAFANSYTLSLVLLIFIAILPSLNALFDWLSLQVSRYFLKSVEKEDAPPRIFIDILLDLIIAILLMLALALVLPAIIELFNNLYGRFDPNAIVDWRAFVKDAVDQPFGKGLMVTAMIITTLIPTVIHIMLGLVAFLLNIVFRKQLANYLRNVGEATWKARFAAFWIQGYISFVVLIMILLYVLFQWVFHLPIGLWLSGLAEWGHDKPVVTVVILLLMIGLGSKKGNKVADG